MVPEVFLKTLFDSFLIKNDRPKFYHIKLKCFVTGINKAKLHFYKNYMFNYAVILIKILKGCHIKKFNYSSQLFFTKLNIMKYPNLFKPIFATKIVSPRVLG